MVAVAVVWRYLYHPRFGLLNRFLGGLGFEPVDWLGDPNWALTWPSSCSPSGRTSATT